VKAEKDRPVCQLSVFNSLAEVAMSSMTRSTINLTINSTMKLLTLALVIGFSFSAFAYKDGTYTCKNAVGIPDNVYKIKTVTLIEGGIQIPYLELTRHMHKSLTDPNSPVIEIRNRGFATVVTTPDSEVLYLGGLHFEFVGDSLQNCK
jgi:hypothetical protein